MYYLYSLFAAILIAIMVVTNGQLSDVYNSYVASVIIHFTGLIVVIIAARIKKKRLVQSRHLPILLYSGGVLGVITTLFTNLSFGKISVTAIIALGLLGQTITSLLIDQFGWFGMPVTKINLPKIVGLIFTMVGIIYLFQGSPFNLIAMILAISTGISIVLSRFVNAMLAEQTTLLQSTWYNFVTGLIVSIILCFIVILFGYAVPTQLILSQDFWIYSGGLLGACVVAISAMCAKKISALILTLIMFVGQLFTGVLLDFLLDQTFSLPTLIGGILTTVGLFISFLPVRKRS